MKLQDKAFKGHEGLEPSLLPNT